MTAYTVIGVWMSGTPVPVGVIEGTHGVEGGDWDAFEEGLWSTSVEAKDVYQAEDAAVAEMRENI